MSRLIFYLSAHEASCALSRYEHYEECIMRITAKSDVTATCPTTTRCTQPLTLRATHTGYVRVTPGLLAPHGVLTTIRSHVLVELRICLTRRRRPNPSLPPKQTPYLTLLSLV